MTPSPKIELHLHLEGAAPPAFIRGLARQKHIDIGGIFDERGAYRFRDFWEFLKVYEAATSTLTTPEDYHRLTLAVLEQSAESGASIPKRSSRPISAAGAMWAHGANTCTRSARRLNRPSAVWASPCAPL